MNRTRLAQKLLAGSPDERKNLLRRHPQLCDVELADALRQICYEVWTSEPQKVSAIVSTLELLNEICGSVEIAASLEWTRAIACLVAGELEKCLARLDESENLFQSIGQTHAAATTQISKLYALALLGRYDQAVACGLRARTVFVAHGDALSAGKIEHNIGNLYWRRDFYREAEPFLNSARRRFSQVKDQRQLAMVENCQAFVKALQNDFRSAEKIYGRALKRARDNALTVTEAEIEIGLSNLFLFQGKFDRALDLMEKSRRSYETLGMPHQSAVCELEIADIYLEMNLLAEAAELSERAAEKFAALGMQSELARALLNHARACLAAGDAEKSRVPLERAAELFRAEGNQISLAAADLLTARIYLREKAFAEAELRAANALGIFRGGRMRRGEIAARLTLGEIALAAGDAPRSRRILTETLKLARENSSPAEYFCLSALGSVALVENDPEEAEKYFLQAVELVENTRSMLAAEEFRTAFAADKLLPYHELVKLKLRKSDAPAALGWLERSRSRVLLELVSGDGLAAMPVSADATESALLAEYKTAREELNWFYNRLNRRTENGLEARREKAGLQASAARREKKLAEIARRLQTGGNRIFGQFRPLDIAALQADLRGATLLEYFALDNRIGVFVLTENDLRVYENLADAAEVEAELTQFLFQIKTGRFIEKLGAENRQTAVTRAISRAQKLYSLLLEPLAEFLTNPRLIVIPSGVLHYLPFQSLHDGARFLLESHEINYAPSAAILHLAARRQPVRAESALLVGVADKLNPAVKTEIAQIGELFDRSTALLNRAATVKNLEKSCAAFDVVHLACHGKFRPDNPLFSALELFRENLTVRDIRGLDLTDKLVVLSACETGLNRVESGDELIGLTRGFWAAGATSLVLSLWTVDDATTRRLMVGFYRNLRAGQNPAEALRHSQIEILRRHPHPYFWSSFILSGRH